MTSGVQSLWNVRQLSTSNNGRKVAHNHGSIEVIYQLSDTGPVVYRLGVCARDRGPWVRVSHAGLSTSTAEEYRTRTEQLSHVCRFLMVF